MAPPWRNSAPAVRRWGMYWIFFFFSFFMFTLLWQFYFVTVLFVVYFQHFSRFPTFAIFSCLVFVFYYYNIILFLSLFVHLFVVLGLFCYNFNFKHETYKATDGLHLFSEVGPHHQCYKCRSCSADSPCAFVQALDNGSAFCWLVIWRASTAFRRLTIWSDPGYNYSSCFKYLSRSQLRGNLFLL